MQKLLLLGLMALFLSACGGSTQPATETTDTEASGEAQTAADPKSQMISDLAGLYVGSTWHSQGYIVILAESNGQLQAKGCQTEGGNPTMEDINEFPEYYPLKTFTTFALNEDGTEFTSDWGKGHIQNGENGPELTFEKLIGSYDPGEDKSDIAVTLKRPMEEEEH